MSKKQKDKRRIHVPPEGTVDKLIMSIKPPYSDNEATIQFKSNGQYYKEKYLSSQDKRERAWALRTLPAFSRTVKFNFEDKNVQNIEYEGNTYNVKLVEIERKRSKNGQEFMLYDFVVAWN